MNQAHQSGVFFFLVNCYYDLQKFIQRKFAKCGHLRAKKHLRATIQSLDGAAIHILPPPLHALASTYNVLVLPMQSKQESTLMSRASSLKKGLNLLKDSNTKYKWIYYGWMDYG